MARSFRLTEQPHTARMPVVQSAPAQRPVLVPAAAPVARRRRHWGLGLLATLVVLAGLFVAANLVTRSVADHQVAAAVKSRTGAQDVSVRISGFPWLVHLLANGTVDGVQVTLHQVPAGRLDLSTVTVDAHNVHVARRLLFSHRQVRITSIGSATVTATISAAALSSVTGHIVTISGSKVEAAIGPLTVPIDVSVSNSGVLSLGVHGVTVFQVPLDRSRIVPSCPMHLFISASSVGVSCHVAPVPQSVLAAMH
jgi:hypothetical protein